MATHPPLPPPSPGEVIFAWPRASQHVPIILIRQGTPIMPGPGHRVVPVCGSLGHGFHMEAPAAAIAPRAAGSGPGDHASHTHSTTGGFQGDRQPVWPSRVTLAVIIAAMLSLARAHAAAPVSVCARSGDDDTARPIPAMLVPAANALFGTGMSTSQAVATTVFRCAHGRVLVCTTGANLPCGPANTNRVPGPGAIDWCRDHPNAAFIPAVATGHDTIFAWRCQSGAPRVARQVHAVDAHGFITQYWKELPE